jgi:aminoglycoside phosphotransferase (APT) family kinase protein
VPAATEVSIEDRLGTTLSRHFSRPVQVEGLELLGGGASRESFGFDAVLGSERKELVLRRDPEGRAENSREHEFELLVAARSGGVPVPEPLFLLTDSDELGSGFVMSRIRGETIGTRILKSDDLVSARLGLARRCGEVLASIHAIPALSVPFLDGGGVSDPAAAQIAHWQEVLDTVGEPHPVLELALRILTTEAPPPAPPAVVHGDFRNGNLVVGGDGLRAVLDWELAHLGDPMEDLGWLCVRAWRFSRPDLAVGGFGSREELFAAYEEASGTAVDAARVRYWEIFGNFKWAVVCLMQADTHLSHTHRSVELAAIGRRACEPEWDLLRLLDLEPV